MAYSICNYSIHWVVVSILLAYGNAHQNIRPGVFQRQGIFAFHAPGSVLLRCSTKIHLRAGSSTTRKNLIRILAITNSTNVWNTTHSTGDPSSSLQSTTSLSNQTCPTAYPANYPVQLTSFTQPCQELSAREQHAPFHIYADTCLRSYCTTSWESAKTSWYNIPADQKPMITSTRTFYQGLFTEISGIQIKTGESYTTITVTCKFWSRDYSTNYLIQHRPAADRRGIVL